MDTDEKLRTGTFQAGTCASFSFAALATELQQVVDQMEMEWRKSQLISRDSVDNLHELRARANKLSLL